VAHYLDKEDIKLQREIDVRFGCPSRGRNGKIDFSFEKEILFPYLRWMKANIKDICLKRNASRTKRLFSASTSTEIATTLGKHGPTHKRTSAIRISQRFSSSTNPPPIWRKGL